ncbi:MAG: exodeoxyribonuclease VII large subunit [Pseudohongiellaceae bacterium]
MPADDTRSTTPSVLTVSSLNRMARSLLEDGFPSVLVEAEISNLAVPASGHWYLTLKDERAQIRCAMFRGRNRSARIRPANGMLVTVRGRISLYEARGDYQLILDSMEEAGAGALQRAFEALKQRLQSEGLFAAEHKKPLPSQCRHVGIITSRTGAALQDMLTVFQRRFPLMQITVLPVPVQGEEAPPAIVKALQIANRRRGELGLDALIVGRGGGSLEDLQAFNEETVARAIAASDLPVISAVGHETDVSISDFAADVRAPTPSAAAELLSPDAHAMQQRFLLAEQRLQSTMQQALSRRAESLRSTVRRLRHPGRRLQEQAQQLDGLDLRLRRSMRQQMDRAATTLEHRSRRLLLQDPRTRLRQQHQLNGQLGHRLQRAMKERLANRRDHLQQLGRALDTVSPLQTLARGYSITTDARGTLVRNSGSLRPGDRINTRLADGEVSSTVDKINP